MRNTTVNWAPFWLLALLCTWSTSRAQLCDESDNLITCWDKFVLPAPTVGDKGVARETLNNVETGVEGATNVASSVKNFLPLLRVAGLVGDDGSADNDGLVLDLNFLIPALADHGQLQAVLDSHPQVYEPLAAALEVFDPASDPETLVGGTTDTSDSYAVNFTYGLASQRMGRGLEQHRTRFNHLFEAAVESATRNTVQERQARLTALTGLVQKGAFGPNISFPVTTFGSIANLQDRAQAIRVAEAMAKEAAATEQRLRENATRLGMSDFAKLISNQPQLNVTLHHATREQFVGPDETTLALTYELGLVNMNSFDKEWSGRCEGADKPNPTDVERATFAACGVAIRQYVEAPNVRAMLEHGDRLTFSLAYRKVDDFAFALPQSTFRFTAQGAHQVTASLSYGRLFGMRDGSADTRIDLQAKYEDASDDQTRNDRVVASLTVTKKVGALSIPIGLVYSNRPEFVGESDAKLGAHIGVIFNTFKDKE